MDVDVIERQTGLAQVEFSPPMRAVGLSFRQEDGAHGPEGVGEVMVAVFDLPDTAPAVGNMARQKIDGGAFRSWLGSMDWSTQTVPFLRDHGNAHLTGHVDSALILGYGSNYREETATVRGEKLHGLVVEEHWNLNTFEGREAFERARFDPYGTQFSFRWTKDETYRGKDGFEHVAEFSDVVESSQVGMGAQVAAGVLAGTLRSMVDEAVSDKLMVTVDGFAARGPIASHSTGTTEPGAAWDGPGAKANLPSSSGPLRRANAWVDPAGDPDAKASYKFIHHEVSSDGSVGSANLRACSTGIGVLNGGRGGTGIPDADRQGVWNHLARHLRDGDQEPPELRMGGDDVEARHAYHGEKVPRKPSSSLLKEWLKDDDFREKVKGLIGGGKGAGETEDGLRSFSLDTVRYRIGSAVESLFAGGGCMALCVDVVAEDGGFASGWVVFGLLGSFVTDETDPADVKAIGGSTEEPAWYRMGFTGSEPDENGMPTRFAFDPAGALEVEQRWVQAGTPLRGGEWAGDPPALDWLESVQRRSIEDGLGSLQEPPGATEPQAVEDEEWAEAFAGEADWYEAAFSK